MIASRQNDGASPRRTSWPLLLLMACSGAWALQLHYGLAAADRGAGLFDLLLAAGLFLLFRQRDRAYIYGAVCRRARILAALFLLLTAWCGGWLDILRQGAFSDTLLYTLYYCNAYVGTYLLYECGLCLLMQYLTNLPAVSPEKGPSVSPAKAFLLCFLGCYAVWLLFLLNQYPGSMESDHMRQLLHVLSGRFENRNPLINSLLVLGCVRLIQGLGGSMNTGIFLYSLVQMGLLAAAFGYGVSLLAKAAFPRRVLWAAGLFCALVPYNVFYSYGMWKDSFFAAWLLLTALKAWGVRLDLDGGKPVKGLDYALLFLFALITAMSRNSGWSALLIWAPCLLIAGRKSPVLRRLGVAVGSGAILALLIMGPLFSALGVEKTADSITVSCVPLQQIGAVIRADKELTSAQAALIDAAADREAIKAAYDPICADPMKDLLYPAMDVLDANRSAYARLWVELGMKHPLTYLRAYRDLVRMYIDPSVSSEVSYKWIYPNAMKIYRDPKLLPALDFGYYEGLLETPALNLLKRPGALLWLTLILWQICALRKNRQARFLFVPFLAVIVCLLPVVPVALFRYVYSLAAALPFLLCRPFCRGKEPA